MCTSPRQSRIHQPFQVYQVTTFRNICVYKATPKFAPCFVLTQGRSMVFCQIRQVSPSVMGSCFCVNVLQYVRHIAPYIHLHWSSPLLSLEFVQSLMVRPTYGSRGSLIPKSPQHEESPTFHSNLWKHVEFPYKTQKPNMLQIESGMWDTLPLRGGTVWDVCIQGFLLQPKKTHDVPTPFIHSPGLPRSWSNHFMPTTTLGVLLDRQLNCLLCPLLVSL